MTRQSISVLSATLVAMLVSGCVSTGRYKALETQYGQMSSKANGLQQDVNRLNDENKTLSQKNDSLSQEKEDLAKTNESTKSQYEQVLNGLQQEVQQGELTITQYKNMLTVDVAEQIFFASGSARLKAKGRQVLKKVGEALAKYPDKTIRVVGHTDNVPLAKAYQAVFPSNWELSVIRATNVVRFLQDECQIPPERLIAEGRGEYDPIAPNDTPENRQKNRRIEITLIDKNLTDRAPAKAPDATAPAAPSAVSPATTPDESPSTDVSPTETTSPEPAESATPASDASPENPSAQ